MNMRVLVPDFPVETNLASIEEVLQGWHERLGHQDKRHVRDILSRAGISIKCSDTASFCDGCVLGKSHRKPLHPRRDRPQSVGELINADVNSPMSIDSLHGFRYYVSFKDDFSRYVRIFFMKEKSEVATHLETFLNECDTAGHKVKTFRSDCGIEFECAKLLTLPQKRGIEFRPSYPYTPEQNGVTEQSNRHVVELARSMFSVSELSKSFWAHACDTAVFLINRTGKSSVPGKTPRELWTGKTFDSFNYLQIFGSECYANIPKKFRSKFNDKADLGYFVGYVNDKDDYKVWIPSKHHIIKSRDVDFRPAKLCTTNNTIYLEYENQCKEANQNGEAHNISVSRVARSMAEPTTSDWISVKRILRYLRVPLIWVFSTPLLGMDFMHIPTQTLQETSRHDDQQMASSHSLMVQPYHGLLNCRNRFLCRPLRLNLLLQAKVQKNWYGSKDYRLKSVEPKVYLFYSSTTQVQLNL